VYADDRLRSNFPLFVKGESCIFAQGQLQGTPVAINLHQNYPNLFKSSTTILFELPEGGVVKLEAIDGLGQLLAILQDSHPESSFKQNLSFS
jgi:hypothetical protein